MPGNHVVSGGKTTIRNSTTSDQPSAILFGHLPGAQFSDGAKKAIERAKVSMLRPDWKKVFEPDAVAESIRQITRQ